jgi:hypothetical protein
VIEDDVLDARLSGGLAAGDDGAAPLPGSRCAPQTSVRANAGVKIAGVGYYYRDVDRSPNSNPDQPLAPPVRARRVGLFEELALKNSA